MLLTKISSRLLLIGMMTMLVGVVLTSCDDSNTPNTPSGRITWVDTSTGQEEGALVTYRPGSSFINISSDTEWILSVEFNETPGEELVPWVYLADLEEGPLTGRGDLNSLKIRYDENFSNSEREAFLVLKTIDGVQLWRFRVAQEANPAANRVDLTLGQNQVTASARSIFISVVASMNWNLSVEYPNGTAAWVTGFEPSSGLGSNNNVIVRFNANETGAARTATIVLTTEDNQTVRATLTQSAGVVVDDPVLRLSATSVEAAGSSVIANIDFDGAWTFTVQYPTGIPAWTTISPQDAQGTGDKAVTITYSANESEQPRTATFILRSNDGKTATATLTQEGKQVVITPTGWLELPAVPGNDPNCVFHTHMMSWNGRQVRNYSVYYDTREKISYWVAYPHISSYEGKQENKSWTYDPQVPGNLQADLSIGTYKGYSGPYKYERGHQIANADRRATRAMNKQTYQSTNSTPQMQALNGAGWAQLEGWVRDQASATDTVYVVTGAILKTRNGNETVRYDADKAGTPVAVPNYYFKVLLKRTSGSPGYKAIGFWYPHEAYSGGVSAARARSVREIENLTGFDFFTNLPADIRDEVETSTRFSDWGVR